MEKLTLIIAALLTSTCCFGQWVQLNDSIKVKLPKGAERLSKEQAKHFIASNFINNKFDLKLLANEKAERMYYKADKILINLMFAT